jgi:hypothetical protein
MRGMEPIGWYGVEGFGVRMSRDVTRTDVAWFWSQINTAAICWVAVHRPLLPESDIPWFWSQVAQAAQVQLYLNLHARFVPYRSPCLDLDADDIALADDWGLELEKEIG